jgi:TonB family protein
VGVGPGSPFGTRYGWYANLLAQRLAQSWRTQDVNARLAAAPPVIVTFVIYRDGRAGDLRLIQRSGDLSLDNSVLRAVTQASPLPELPRDYQGNSVTVEYWFELKR